MAVKDYAAIAANRIHRPGSDNRPPCLLVYGRNKKGKTRFCTTAPNVLILDPEDGTAEEKRRNPAVWPIDSWQDAQDAYGYLRTGKHPYEWIALDPITRLANVALRQAMGLEPTFDLSKVPKGARIQHYGQANEMVRGLLYGLHSMRKYGIIITAQERMVEIGNIDEMDDDESTSTDFMYVPDVPKGLRSSVNAIVDLTGRMYVVPGDFTRKVRNAAGKVETVTETRQRRLWIGVDERYETGFRSDHTLPDFIPNPTVATVVRMMKEGK